MKYWEMDDKREVPQRQAGAYYKLLDNPCVHHSGCLISHSIVNEQCKDVGKTGFLNCQLTKLFLLFILSFKYTVVKGFNIQHFLLQLTAIANSRLFFCTVSFISSLSVLWRTQHHKL